MRAYGYKLKEEQLKAAIDYMKASTNFRSNDIKCILINEGVPEIGNFHSRFDVQYTAKVITNRLLQILKKEGKIQLEPYSIWKWSDASSGLDNKFASPAELKSRLIKAAASLLTNRMSDLEDDYPQRFPKYILKEIEKHNDKLASIASEIRKVANTLNHKATT